MSDVPEGAEPGRGDGGDDDDPLHGLREFERGADPVPDHVRRAAKESFAARSPAGTELAELARDSAVDEGRADDSQAASRALAFNSLTLTIEIELGGAQRSRRLTGRLVPAQSAGIEVLHSGGVTETEAGDDGRFALDGVPAGPTSIRCRLRDGRRAVVQTDWVTL